jgi:hypothetical protein
LQRVWNLRSNVSVRDAFHLAPAETLNAPLFIRDRHPSNAVVQPAHIAWL